MVEIRRRPLLRHGTGHDSNPLPVTMRKSYGFRTFRCLELALDHSLGKLPDLESTHEFF
jgi:hypothetical protein